MKIPKQEYTTEFKELSVKRVKAGQSIGSVAKDLELIEQTLRNWVMRWLRSSGQLPGRNKLRPVAGGWF